MPDDISSLLVVINAGTLASIVFIGYKVLRFINRIEFKTELMWRDYTERVSGYLYPNLESDNQS